MTRLNFGLLFAKYAFAIGTIVMVVLIVLKPNYKLPDIFQLFTFLILPTAVAAYLSAQIFYLPTENSLVNKKLPWKQCIGIIISSYPIFAFLAILIGSVIYPGNFKLNFNEDMLGAFLLWTIYPFVLTFWITIPLGIFISRQLFRSNKQFQPTANV